MHGQSLVATLTYGHAATLWRINLGWVRRKERSSWLIPPLRLQATVDNPHVVALCELFALDAYCLAPSCCFVLTPGFKHARIISC